MNKTFWIFLSITVAVLIGVFVIFNDDQAEPVEQVENPQEITSNDHAVGPENAPVTLVEYGDFQCPACGAAEPLLVQAREEFGDDLRFVYRHFPLTSIHPNAFAAAQASEAADKQGKFWEMHDLLFQRQNDWSANTNAQSQFEDYAEELELNLEDFRQDYNNARARVNRDVNIGQQLGIGSTPTFYINGELVEQNPRTYEELKELIEARL